MIKAKNIIEIEELICDKKVFLFDFDGVVAHTERLQWEAYNIVLGKYNVIITKKDILMNTNEYLKVQNSNIAYFEDMDRNLKMASELNITTIGIEHEFNYNKLDNCNAIITGEPI